MPPTFLCHHWDVFHGEHFALIIAGAEADAEGAGRRLVQQRRRFEAMARSSRSTAPSAPSASPSVKSLLRAGADAPSMLSPARRVPSFPGPFAPADSGIPVTSRFKMKTSLVNLLHAHNIGTSPDGGVVDEQGESEAEVVDRIASELEADAYDKARDHADYTALWSQALTRLHRELQVSETQETAAPTAPTNGTLRRPFQVTREYVECLQFLRSMTGLEQMNIGELLQHFSYWTLQSTAVAEEDRVLSRSAFDYCILQLPRVQAMPHSEYRKIVPLLNTLFAFLDLDGNGVIDRNELTSGLAILCGGDKQAKLRMTFDLFDADSDGFLDREEMYRYMRALFRGTVAIGAGFQELTREEIAAQEPEHIERALDLCFEACDYNRDGRLSIDEFLSWHANRPDQLNFLALLNSREFTSAGEADRESSPFARFETMPTSSPPCSSPPPPPPPSTGSPPPNGVFSEFGRNLSPRVPSRSNSDDRLVIDVADGGGSGGSGSGLSSLSLRRNVSAASGPLSPRRPPSRFQDEYVSEPPPLFEPASPVTRDQMYERMVSAAGANHVAVASPRTRPSTAQSSSFTQHRKDLARMHVGTDIPVRTEPHSGSLRDLRRSLKRKGSYVPPTPPPSANSQAHARYSGAEFQAALDRMGQQQPAHGSVVDVEDAPPLVDSEAHTHLALSFPVSDYGHTVTFTTPDLERLETIRRVTGLGSMEVSDMLEHFYRFASNDRLNRAQFRACVLALSAVSGMGDTSSRAELLEHMDSVFDWFVTDEAADSVSLRDFTTGLAVLCGGDHRSKLRVLFDLADANRDGYVTRGEMGRFLSSLYRGIVSNSSVEQQYIEALEEVIIDKAVAECFDSLDSDADGRISFAEWTRWRGTAPKSLSWLAMLDMQAVPDESTEEENGGVSFRVPSDLPMPVSSPLAAPPPTRAQSTGLARSGSDDQLPDLHMQLQSPPHARKKRQLVVPSGTRVLRFADGSPIFSFTSDDVDELDRVREVTGLGHSATTMPHVWEVLERSSRDKAGVDRRTLQHALVGMARTACEPAELDTFREQTVRRTAERLFSIFDREQGGLLELHVLVVNLTPYIGGGLSKLTHAFLIFDTNTDGVLNYSQLYRLFRALFRGAASTSLTARYAKVNAADELENRAAIEAMESLFAHVRVDDRKQVTLDDFASWLDGIGPHHWLRVLCH